MTERKKIKKYIMIGFIGAWITVAGEMCQGFVPSVNAAGKMMALFSSFDNLPVWRIGLGSTIGAIGILLQFYKKQTPFPKWIWLLNPLFGKAFFNIITALMPSSALTNGISYSNMGLSSVILFVVLLLFMDGGNQNDN